MTKKLSSRAKRGDLPFYIQADCHTVLLEPGLVGLILHGKTVRNDEENIIACLSVRHRERSAAICLVTFRRIATPFCWNLAWLAKFLVAKPFTMPGAFPSCHPPNKRG